MRLPTSLVLALLVPTLVVSDRPVKRYYNTHDYYVIEHNPLLGVSLVDITAALDVELVDRAGELKDHWLVATKKPEGLTTRDDEDRIIARFEHLRSVADNQLVSRSEESLKARAIVDSVLMLDKQVLRRREKRAPAPVIPASSSRAVAERFGISDPLFSKQWHLVNDEHPEHMMNVTGLWAMGLTGKDVIASFIDDGLDYTAEDLKDNFVSFLSCLAMGTLNLSPEPPEFTRL